MHQLTSQTAEDLKQQGNQAFLQKNYEEAIKLYGESLSIRGANPTVLSNRSQCYLSLQDWESAYNDADTGLQFNPEVKIRVKLLFRKAVAAKNLNLGNEASRSLQEVIRLEPTNRAAIEELKTLPSQSILETPEVSEEVPIPLSVVQQLPEEFRKILDSTEAPR